MGMANKIVKTYNVTKELRISFKVNINASQNVTNKGQVIRVARK